MEKQFCSEKITNLAKAMLEVQKVVRPACKDKLNDFTHSRYATLNSVMDACSEALIDNGIWVTQYPVPVEGDGKLGLVTKLVHAESGEWQESLIVMPLAKADPQAYGSALTYARRYGLSAMVGLVTEDDDDANMACQGYPSGKQDFDCPELKKPQISSLKPRVNLPSNNSLQNRVIEKLPHIDGVSYQQQKAKDGAVYITATGNVRNRNGILKEAGFKWSTGRKIWWKAA